MDVISYARVVNGPERPNEQSAHTISYIKSVHVLRLPDTPKVPHIRVYINRYRYVLMYYIMYAGHYNTGHDRLSRSGPDLGRGPRGPGPWAPTRFN